MEFDAINYEIISKLRSSGIIERINDIEIELNDDLGKNFSILLSE